MLVNATIPYIYYVSYVMALIIETGAGIAGANTYVSDAEYVAYAASLGKTIGVDAPTREIELVGATYYLDSFRDKYQGWKTVNTNSLQFPRSNVYIDNYIVADNAIPVELERAQMEAAIFSITTPLFNDSANQNIKIEQLAQTGKIEYFSGGSLSINMMSTVQAYLKPLLAGGYGLGVARRI